MRRKPNMQAMEKAVRVLIEEIGEDPSREGLVDTPKRVARALIEMTSGYDLKPSQVVKTRFDAEGFDQQVALWDIEFQSICEHHLIFFSGLAAVGYIPNKDKREILGISKLARLVELYARRLQNQERIASQVAAAIEEAIEPMGVAVVLRAKHGCIGCRGVRKPGAVMGTSVMNGIYRHSESARAEFFCLINQSGS